MLSYIKPTYAIWQVGLFVLPRQGVATPCYPVDEIVELFLVPQKF